MGRFEDLGRVLSAGAHILVGALFVGDGIQKLAYAGGEGPASATVVWFAGGVELLGGALVAARWRSRAAAADRAATLESESRERR